MRWLIGMVLALVAAGLLLYPRLERRRQELAVDQLRLELEALLPLGSALAIPAATPAEQAWRADLEALVAAMRPRLPKRDPAERARLEALFLDPIGVAALARGPLWPRTILADALALSDVLRAQATAAFRGGDDERALELLGRLMDATQGLDRPDLIGLLNRVAYQRRALDLLEFRLPGLDRERVLRVMGPRLEAALEDHDWQDAVEFEARELIRVSEGYRELQSGEDIQELIRGYELFVHLLTGTTPGIDGDPWVEARVGSMRSTEATYDAYRARIRKLLGDLRVR